MHLEAIGTILGALGKDWAYAAGIGKQMFGTDSLDWLSPEQLHKVQVALIYQYKRTTGGTPAPPRGRSGEAGAGT